MWASNIYINKYFQRVNDKIFFLFVLLLCIIPVSKLKAQKPEEDLLKGVLFEKIVNFVTWPDLKNSDETKENLIIGVYDESPMYQVLDKLYSDRLIQGMRVKIIKISNLSQVNKCNILYIPKISADKLDNLVEFAKRKPILTLSDSKGYAEKGVHINFYRVENNIRFEINEKAVRESGIKMHYLLLQLAQIVESR